jgi:hypothetical protein
MAFTFSAPNGHHLRFARTQREAGLEWCDWEGRLEPLRPLYRDVVIVAIGILAAIAIAFGFSLI